MATRLGSNHDPFGDSFKEFRPAPDGVNVEEVPCKYPSNEFIVPASDSKGRTARVQSKITPMLARQVTEAVTCRKFGFRTESDVVRWCVKYGLNFLHELEPDYAPFMMRVNAELEILREAALRASLEDVIGELEKTVRLCLEKGELPEAQRLVKQTYDRFYNSEDDIWRKRILAQIKDKFRYVMEQKPVVERRRDPWAPAQEQEREE